MESQDNIFLKLRRSIASFDSEGTLATVKQALANGIAPVKIIEDGLAVGLREVGDRFEKGELILVELVFAAGIMEEASSMVQPEITKSKVQRKALGKIVLGTVEGDIHDIGKNIVKALLEAPGFEVHDVGKDTPAEHFIVKAREIEADVIGASSLLTTTLPRLKQLANAIAESDLKVKYIVGGAAVMADYAKEIGAHYAPDAFKGVEVIRNLVGHGG